MTKTPKKTAKAVVSEKLYDVLTTPVITEKSTIAAERNQFVFKVPLEATKPEIAAAVEGLFKVKVKAVNTLRVEGKNKMFRGMRGRRSDWKKAIISLVDGEKIDLTTGL